MDLLKQSRGHLKGTITRAYNFALEISDELEIEQLEVRLERLEETWKAFCANQNELFVFHADQNYGDPETDFQATENKYLVAKGAFIKAIRKRRSVPETTSNTEVLFKQQAAVLESLLEKSNPSNSNSKAEIELPAFKITPFSGDYREWPGFRDMFLGSIDCKKNFPGAQKLRYLKSFLRDDAAKLLNHIEISDGNYALASEKLENRYNKPLYIINAYIENFLKIPTVLTLDSSKLRNLTDNADEVVRGLRTLESEGRDPWLIYILLSKVDSDTRKSWALENANAEEATINELIEFLDKRCSALEASEVKFRTNKTFTRSNTVPKVKSLTASNLSCPKCKSNHSLPECQQFNAMPIHSRRDFVRDQKLCYKCLGPNHSSSKCKSKSRCSECRFRHHSLVHLNKPNPVSSPVVENNFEPSAVSGSAPADQFPLISNHIKNGTRPSGILPTVVVNVRDVNGNLQRCRVLIDTGSQVSFASEKLVKRLGLRRRHARIPISGISSLEAGVTNGVINVKLFSFQCKSA